jgi:hypothetical protein
MFVSKSSRLSFLVKCEPILVREVNALPFHGSIDGDVDTIRLLFALGAIASK